jgi:DNA-binding LytR/AlgR family response regulator
MVIDDEPHSIEVLQHYIEQTQMLRLVATSDNPVAALEVLHAQPVDVIFLDIHMPQMTGLDFIRTIQKRYKVVLCTAYPDYALEGFELDVIDYLVKPIPLARFLRAMQKIIAASPGAGGSMGAEGGGAAGGLVGAGGGAADTADRRPGGQDDFILVKTGARGSMTRIDITQIQYVEAKKNYVDIYHDTGHTLALLSMKELEERLPSASFMRIHKSYIVAIRQIAAIEGNEIRLKDRPVKLLIGESYRQPFFDAMKERLMGRP